MGPDESADSRHAVHLVVRGLVQGVFFRDTCRQVATDAGASGWVRNREDGSVEAVVEGTPGAVEAVVDWARHGPSGADVQALDVTNVEPEARGGFTVR